MVRMRKPNAHGDEVGNGGNDQRINRLA